MPGLLPASAGNTCWINRCDRLKRVPQLNELSDFNKMNGIKSVT